MIKRNYELEVLVNGKPLKEYFHSGKTYIEGKKDSVFTVRLRNNSSERVLFVPSIDGLSVIDGKDASFKSRGYIVDAYSSMLVDGWRLNDNDVAEFFFSSPDKSYRKRQEKGNNLGSIAVAVFREKEKIREVIKETIKYIPYPDPYPVYPKCPWHHHNFPIWCSHSGNITLNATAGWTGQATATSATFTASSLSSKGNLDAGGGGGGMVNMARSVEVSQALGTGFGETKRSEVVSAVFDKEESPDAVLEVLYNSREELENLGIDFNRRPKVISEPVSFPNEKGYCERPRD